MTDTMGHPRSRGTTITMGVAMALAGIALLIWPGATTLVLVSLLALAIIAYGVHELIGAVRDTAGRSRLWSGVIGAIAVIGGVAIFMAPVVGTVTVGLVIGWVWLIEGSPGSWARSWSRAHGWSACWSRGCHWSPAWSSWRSRGCRS